MGYSNVQYFQTMGSQNREYSLIAYMIRQSLLHSYESMDIGNIPTTQTECVLTFYTRRYWLKYNHRVSSLPDNIYANQTSSASCYWFNHPPLNFGAFCFYPKMCLSIRTCHEMKYQNSPRNTNVEKITNLCHLSFDVSFKTEALCSTQISLFGPDNSS